MKNICKITPFVLISILLFACSHEEPTDATPEDAPEMPDQEMWHSDVKMTNKGELSAIIHFGHMSRYMKKSLTLFNEGVNIDFYKENNVIGSQLVSEAGQFNQDSKNVKATGNVVVESDSGLTLYTQELYYYQKSDRILSNVDVMVCTANGDTLYGRGFESDTQMNNWKIISPYDGVAHKSVDLSLERFEKNELPDTLEIDTTNAADSLLVPALPDAAQP